MTGPSRIRYGMPTRKPTKSEPKREVKRPPPEFGRVAEQLMQSVGMTRKDLPKVTGRVGPRTFERLLEGGGSLHYALALKKALRARGADVSKLPPLDEVEDEEVGMPEWRREWIRLGEIIHRLATPEQFASEMKRVTDKAKAFLVIANELDEISRPTVSDDRGD